MNAIGGKELLLAAAQFEQNNDLQHYRRRLYLFLRLIWGDDFLIQSHAGMHPFLQQRVLFLPEQLDYPYLAESFGLYRAMALHLSAHLRFSQPILSSDHCDEVEQFFVGLVEDARIEYLAMRHEPSLQKIWLEQLYVHAYDGATEKNAGLIKQLIAGMLDATQDTSESRLNEWLKDFHQALENLAEQRDFSLHWGRGLMNMLQQMDITLELDCLKKLNASYRDDNRSLWIEEQPSVTLAYKLASLEQLGEATLPKTVWPRLYRKYCQQQ